VLVIFFRIELVHFRAVLRCYGLFSCDVSVQFHSMNIVNSKRTVRVVFHDTHISE
jgi:hypothetical protein